MADLDERFRSLSRTGSPDLWADIETREPRSGIAPTPWPHRALAAAVAMAIAVAGVGFAALTFTRSESPKGSAAGAMIGRIAFVGISDSTWQVFSTTPQGTDRLRVTQLEPPFVASDPAWSGDGKRLAFVVRKSDTDGGEIWVAKADGSSPHEAIDLSSLKTGGVTDPVWSPDDREMAFAAYGEEGGIFIASLAGGDPQLLTGAAGTYQDSEPVWSPDGGSIAFIRHQFAQGAGSSWQILRVERGGGQPTVVAEFPDRNTPEEPGLSWSPDGSRLAFSLHGSLRVLDLASGAIDEVVSCEALGCDENTHVFTNSPSWSPDGSQIVFEAWLDIPSNRTEPPLIYIATLDSDKAMVASMGIEGFSPAWGAARDSFEPGPMPSPGQLAPTSAEVVDTFEVGTTVSSVAYGDGSVWVAVLNNDGSFGGRIVRFDPETHEVQADIPVDVTPTWEVGGGAMVVSDGSLWVTGSLEAPGAFDDPGGGADAGVIRIDTTTNEVVQTFALGGTHGADLAFIDGQLWVLVFGDETVDNAMEVVRVDPQTGEEGPRFTLDASWAHTIVAAEGMLVTAVGGQDAVNVDGRVIQIDPDTSAISGSGIPSQSFTPMPVLWHGQVWISTDPGFVRYEPLREGFPEPGVTLPPRFGDCCGFLESDDRGIWFLSTDLDGGPPHLNRFDPVTGEATALTQVDEGSPVAMAIAPDSVWILNYEGTLTHVALG